MSTNHTSSTHNACGTSQGPGGQQRRATNHRRLATAYTLSALTAFGGLSIAAAPQAAALGPCSAPTPPPYCADPPIPPRKPLAATPANFSVVRASSHDATLTWTDLAGDEKAFAITRYQGYTAAAPQQMAVYTIQASPGATSFNWTDTGLGANNSVSWKIVALPSSAAKSQSTQAVTGTLAVDIPTHVYVNQSDVAPQLQSFQRDYASTSPFARISRGQTLADLINILLDPVTFVSQANTGACGPSAVIYELRNRHPDWLINDVRALTDTGGFTTPDGTRYWAHSELLASSIPSATRSGLISSANWLLMATMKDAINPTARISDHTTGDDLAWASSPADVDNWLQHVVGLRPQAAMPWGPFAAPILQPALASSMATTLSAHGTVVLLLDSSLVGNEPGIISTPNHYVDLRSLTWTPTTITIEVKTWTSTKVITVPWSCFNTQVFDVLPALP